MMKSSELVLIVETVEEGVKFYTEKLGFDIVDLQESSENGRHLIFARLHKGKCSIILRAPLIEELAAFSFIKRCVNRCTGIYVEMKKGLEKYYQRCIKKGVKVVGELKKSEFGNMEFSIRDPFGATLIFAEPLAKDSHQSFDVFGITVDKNALKSKNSAYIKATSDQLISTLKEFGILRRASKKFAKSKLKELSKALK
ncbi:MAG: VOC family protein [Candidatus Babeliales bacterium]|jgi:uncharacterized glyoxalase superfamily protein PhnB|nr:MAG: hypothetical protein US22_C0023G0009 [candidate division TM6 bacterium GW2011_GWF2_36_6]